MYDIIKQSGCVERIAEANIFSTVQEAVDSCAVLGLAEVKAGSVKADAEAAAPGR